MLSTSNVWTALSVLLFYIGKFQGFPHLASVTGCNTDVKFETLNLAGTPSEWEGLRVEERMNAGGCFTVIFLLVAFSFCNFYG